MITVRTVLTKVMQTAGQPATGKAEIASPLRWQRFVQALAGRYQHAAWRPPAALMRLAHPPAAGWTQVTFHLSPVLRLSLERQLAQPAPIQPPSSPPVLPPGLKAESSQPVARPVGALSEQRAADTPLRRVYARLPAKADEDRSAVQAENYPGEQAQQTYQRLALKRRRQEERPAQVGPTASPDLFPPQPAQPHPAHAPRPDVPVPLENEPAEQVWESRYPRRPGRSVQPGRMGEANINIEQLADQVIRQIDSRILAQRERMGKLFG